MNIQWLSSQIYLKLDMAAAAKSLQSCLTLCDPMDSSPPGSSVPGILQARTLERVANSFSHWHGQLFYFHWKLLLSKYLSYFFTYDSDYFSFTYSIFPSLYQMISNVLFLQFSFHQYFPLLTLFSLSISPGIFLTLAAFSM